jgi:hypothetical protein
VIATRTPVAIVFSRYGWDEKGCSSSGGRTRTCDTRIMIPLL